MINPKILNARQLLLLCIIRKEVVRAKNLHVFGKRLPSVRSFYARFGDYLSLADQDEDLSWYWHFMDDSPKYCGEFELEFEATEREMDIISTFCPFA
jgi:hypothetical protein